MQEQATSRTAVDEAVHSLRENVDEVRTELAAADERVRQLVTQRPLLALIGAFAGGFALARFLARR